MSELEKTSETSDNMTFEISTAHFDNTLETVLAISVAGIFFAAVWIVAVLVEIEASKVSFFSVEKDLEFSVEDERKDSNGPSSLELERASEAPAQEIRTRRNKVTFGFKMMQLGSVYVLVLLTYLLLDASSAPMALSALGSICVFCAFLRYQIGDELRRQRWDRLLLLMSLFLTVASFLNMATYTWKSLAQGEVYMGPARIVGYDQQPYNNSNTHDPTTRTDLMVQWGRDWGCPFSGGKLCQAHVQGVMCAFNPDADDGSRKLMGFSSSPKDSPTASPQHSSSHYSGSHNNNGSHNNGNNQNEKDLEKENNELEQENEELQKEIDELEEQSDVEEDEAIDTEYFEEEEMLGNEYQEEEEVVEMEEEVDEAHADEDEMEEDMDKDEIEDELKETTDDSVKQELEQDIEELDAEEDETEQQLDEQLDEEDEIADEYDEAADEMYDEAASDIDEAIDEMYDEEEIDAEIEETKDEVDAIKEDLNENVTDSETYGDDWYWEDANLEYDDDAYDSNYWEYDWDSAWGEYGCSDLFNSDILSKTYDANVPAGGDDDWPFINIYGSCKTCDAYILDYFAEEAFIKYDDYFINALMYLGLASVGMGLSLIGFIKYKLQPPAENRMELLGSDGGVLA